MGQAGSNFRQAMGQTVSKYYTCCGDAYHYERDINIESQQDIQTERNSINRAPSRSSTSHDPLLSTNQTQQLVNTESTEAEGIATTKTKKKAAVVPPPISIPIQVKPKEWKWKQKLKEQETQKQKEHARPAAGTAKNSQIYSSSLNNLDSLLAADKEQSDREHVTDVSTQALSLKERKKVLSAASSPVNTEEHIRALKEERNLGAVKVTMASKKEIKSLFKDRLEKHKAKQGATLSNSEQGKKLKEALKNVDQIDPETVVTIVQDLGLFAPLPKTPVFKKKKKKKKNADENTAMSNSNNETESAMEEEEEQKLEVLNMNNSAMMEKMSDTERGNMENLICESLITNHELKQVQMCNANVSDQFLLKILNKLESNPHNIAEIWLENNPISDEGMKYLSAFMQRDDKITVIKLYGNKKTISTGVLEEMLNALSKNTSIVKFVFDGFRFQDQKDKRERYLRRNQEIARQKRNEERKRLKEAAAQKP